MSTNDSFEWIFNNYDVNLGSNLQNDELSFKNTFDNSRLIGDGANYYNINDYPSIIYTDLESILYGESFTLNLTLTESFTDTSKPGNLFTLGYHTRGSKNTCITVGRKAITREVVLGTMNDLITFKGNILSTSNIIESDTPYEYIVVHNSFDRENNKFRLYINETGTYSLICDSSGLSNISILQPKLFIGSSLWTNEPEWNNQFDLCDVTLTSNITLTINKTIYPVDILTTLIETNLTNNVNTDILIGEQFSVELQTQLHFVINDVKLYVTSTIDGNNIELLCENRIYNSTNDLYSYIFTDTITDQFYSGSITYLYDMNGTSFSRNGDKLNVILTEPWFGEWITPFNTSSSEIEVAWDIDNSNTTPQPLDMISSHFERSQNTNRISFSNGVARISNRSHMLSYSSYSLPLYVECELMTTKNGAMLLLENGTYLWDQNQRMNQAANSITWGTSQYDDTLQMALNGTTAPTKSDLSHGTFKKFSIYVSDTVIVAYLDDVEQYRFTNDAYEFPDWAAVQGGSVRVGVYGSSTNTNGNQFKNLIIFENLNRSSGYTLEIYKVEAERSTETLLPTRVDLSLFDLASASTIILDGTGTVSTNDRTHMLSHQEFKVPMLVECELFKGNNTTSLLVGTIIRTSGTDMTSSSDTITFGTGSGSSRNKFHESVAGTGTSASVDSLRANWNKFSIYISTDSVIMYQNDVEWYSHYSSSTTFPSWLVSGGVARIGMYTHSANGNFRNFKVTENPPITVNPMDTTHTFTGLLADTVYSFILTDIDTGVESSVLTIKTSNIIRTEFISSNRDLTNNLVKTSFRINSMSGYEIESVCFAAPITNYATDTSLFSGSSGLDTFPLTGPHNVVVSTPYTFTMDETQSQWVYYRFVGEATVYEVEIESIYRYGWVASSTTKWVVDYTMLSNSDRNSIFVLAHEADTTVIVTHSDDTSTQYTLSQYEITTTGALYDPVSIRANKPIQLGGNVWHERYFINISLRDTNFLIPTFSINNMHDHEIYIHQDNTTVQYSDAEDYQSLGTFHIITYPTKGLYTMQWGSSTSLRITDYQYMNLKQTVNTRYLGGGIKILKADKPVSGHVSSLSYYNMQWIPPTKNEPNMALRWTNITIGGWWCFDNDASYDSYTVTFNVRTTAQTTHTVNVSKYDSVNYNGGVKNWTGTTNSVSSGACLISKSVGTPFDVYFMVISQNDGNGGEASMTLPVSYSSTAYVQVINNSSSSSDPAYIYSFDDGVQSIIKDSIDPVLHVVLSSETYNYDFTNDYTKRLGGVRHFVNTLALRNDRVYRTSSANTYISVYVNSDGDREEWVLGNIPNVHAILFTPL